MTARCFFLSAWISAIVSASAATRAGVYVSSPSRSSSVWSWAAVGGAVGALTSVVCMSTGCIVESPPRPVKLGGASLHGRREPGRAGAMEIPGFDVTSALEQAGPYRPLAERAVRDEPLSREQA